METSDKLIELAKKIQQQNPKAAFSGSLALNLQEVKTRRQPGDIDIYIPYDIIFSPIEGMVEIDDFNKDDYNDDYNDDEYKRTHYSYLGEIKIDVFTPIDNDSKMELLSVGCKKGINLIRFDEVMKFKIRFAFDSHSSAEKHAEDLIFSLQQQQLVNTF
jgi:hypothetical protein